MNKKITRCVACHSDQIKKKRGRFPVKVHNETMVVPDIEFYVCSRCSEMFLDIENESKIDRYVKEHRGELTAVGAS